MQSNYVCFFSKMNIRNTILFLVAMAFVYILSVTGSSCAQIGMPLGGPKDTIPPVLLNSDPPNGTIHFKGNRIVLTFDEYIQLKSLQDYLLVAPTPKIMPNVDFKLKTVTIKLRDTLQPNTTYNIQLGNSIQDLNESNPFREFNYVFSTGDYIDSLQFRGNVILAETGKPDTTLLVFLYKNLDDSAVYKEKPVYIARVNKKGDFQFQHLAAGTYNVFALKDESGQKKYNDPTQIFAFADSAIKISNDITPINLFAYAEAKTGPKSASEKKTTSEKKLTYATSIKKGTQDLLSPLTLEFSNALKGFDSLKIKLTDTLFKPVASAMVTIDTSHKEVIVNNKWEPALDYRLLVEKDFATDTSGIALLKSDTVKFKTKSENEYGSIKINFKNLDKFQHPVLQFIVNNEVISSFPITSATWSQRLFPPGDYDLRILDDSNQNGIWDPGNYHLKKQPEKVYSITQKLNLKADWENERDIIL
ncbi:MAG: Ig-like domain-containing protein [Bacteroidota bacterium]|nr:Ig-like domain-containing protein [Bacteroidota bacterium]